jgi:hypothetical protein
MEQKYYSEALVDICLSTPRHTPEYRNPLLPEPDLSQFSFPSAQSVQ